MSPEPKPNLFPSFLLRSSITRLSVEDKDFRSKEVSKQERDLLLLNKAPLVSETIPESNRSNAASNAAATDKEKESDSEIGRINNSVRHCRITFGSFRPCIFLQGLETKKHFVSCK
jgi:hypothetical protein